MGGVNENAKITHKRRPKMIGIKLLAYLVMERLSALTRLTSHQINLYAKREIDLCSFFDQHFHLPDPSEPLCYLAQMRK